VKNEYYPFMGGSFTLTSFTHEGGPRIDKEPGQPDLLPELFQGWP